MGVCGSASFGKLKDNSARFDIEPADTESLKGQSLPTLAFYILLSDLKIKKCSYDYIGLRFKIEGIHNEECAVKEVDRQQRVYWKLYKTFEFMTNEYELRRKFLEIEAYNLKKQVIGSLKINLYMIWTGPYHLDFKLPLKQCKTCRISFNFKMSQGISFKLQDLKTEFLPNEVKVEGQRFTFTLSAIIGQKTEPSSYAYNIVVGQNKNQAKQHFQLSPTKYISKQKTIKWQNIDKFPQLPSFQQTVAYYQVYSSSLHLCFWRIQPGIQDPSILRYESEGECFISLNKLMTLDYTITKDPVTNINYVNRKVLLNQKIWLHGKELGSANIQFRYSLQAHQKQMQACVRTEQGILTSTPVFSGDNSQKLHECEQIVALKKLHTQIQKQFINLDQECERKNSFITKKEIVLRIYNLLERKLALIEKSHKESILFYSYQDESELIRAQRFLINFAFNILSYIHEDIMDLNNICWNILTAILRRGEFKLSHMCFSKEFKDELLNNKNSQKLREKSETCFKYLELMNELLKETLRALEIKGNENEQMFAENYCAYAYFRMPIFREHILQMIKSAKDPDIQEWRGSENNLYHDGSSQDLGVIDDFYDNLFDWESNFMRPLAQSNPARYKQNIDRFQVTLLEDRWKIRLAKRGGAFYTFLQNLVKEIEYVCVVSKHIRWHYLPGYNRLLQAFLVEMKFTKIREYSQRFKRCCVQILANQKLLNIFVVILLSRTNVNDPETVHDAFELIGSFFTFIKNKRRVIPSTFDYKYLMQGIKMVLNSELQFSIEKVLILLYDNFSFFSQQFSLELGLYIMANLFHKFFFHWSYNLRHIFHTILYTRILRIQYHKNESPAKTNGESNYITGLKVALKQYHEHLINTIKEEVDPNAFYSNADQFYQKDLFKKMKAKLKKKTLIRVHSSLLLNSKRQDLVPDHIAPSKSVGTNVKFIIPKKLLFFKQEELLPKPVKKEYTAYAKVALEEYKETVQNIKNRQKSDPNYAPQMRVKKILDQIQLKPLTSQEW